MQLTQREALFDTSSLRLLAGYRLRYLHNHGLDGLHLRWLPAALLLDVRLPLPLWLYFVYLDELVPQWGVSWLISPWARNAAFDLN